MNDLAMAGTVLTSPTAAFTELRERPRFLVPMLMIILAMVLQMFWYYNVVDIAWLKDHMFNGNARMDAMPTEARERFLGAMSKNMLMWPSIIGMAIMVPLMFVLISAYYLLAGKITNVQYSFKHWMALSAWSSLPMLIGLAAGSIMLLMQGSNAQMGPSELQILSANELFFQLSPAHPGAQLLMQLNPITFWTWALSIIAVKLWSNRSWVYSSVFVLLPIVVIFGGWALFAF
jgi:hypothetical protein